MFCIKTLMHCIASILLFCGCTCFAARVLWWIEKKMCRAIRLNCVCNGFGRVSESPIRIPNLSCRRVYFKEIRCYLPRTVSLFNWWLHSREIKKSSTKWNFLRILIWKPTLIFKWKFEKPRNIISNMNEEWFEVIKFGTW